MRDEQDIKPMEGVATQNKRGQWVPAIEEPYFLAFGRCQCRCGRKFWSRESYRAHYALKHILAVN